MARTPVRRATRTNTGEKIYTSTVDNVANLRHEEMNMTFPTISRENFASEEEYRNALETQYRAMREKEFSYVVSDEATKAYMVATQANCQAGTRCQNTQAWQNYSKNRDQTLVADSCFNRTRDIAIKSDGLTTNGECCAISSTSLIAQISGEMGYDGNKNLIQPKSRLVTLPNGQKDVGANNNPGAASWIERLDSIPEKYKLTPQKISRQYPRGVTLNKAITDGLVKAGDEISIITNANNSNPNQTGCHAMVVVDVIKDSQGKVTSYTLQCNNPPCLKHIKANDSSEYYSNKKLNCAVKVNDWMNDKIKTEVTSSMTTEQLEAKVAEERSRLSSTIDDLQKTERYLASNDNYMRTTNYNRIDGYCAHYNNIGNTLTNNIAQLRLPALEEEVRKKELELAQREATLKQKEEQYQKELMAYNPEAAVSRQEETPPAAQEQTPVEQQKDVSQMSLQDRVQALHLKQEELRQREEDLINREYEQHMKESELAITKAQRQVDHGTEDKETKRQKPTQRQARQQQPDEENARLNSDTQPVLSDQPVMENIFPSEPQVRPVTTEPQVRPVTGEPQVRPVTTEPQVRPVTGEPQMIPIETREQMKSQTGERQETSFAEIKSGPMYVGTEMRAIQEEHNELSNQRTGQTQEQPRVTHIMHLNSDGTRRIEKIDEQQPQPTEETTPRKKEIQTISVNKLLRVSQQNKNR